MITKEEILKKEPNLNNAWDVCNILFPDFGSLTIPMQGMVAASFLSEEIEYEDIWLTTPAGKKDIVHTEVYKKIVWDIPNALLYGLHKTELLPISSYAGTLNYAKRLIKMHLNWELEK